MRRRSRCSRFSAGNAGAVFLVTLLAAAALPPGRAAASDFAEGLAAYDAGDLRAAYVAWLPLAEAGDSQAQVALAGLLESGGPGIPRDPVAAASWYRRAAEAGDAVAQMNLAELYQQGRGLPRDPLRAYAWFILAAEQGQGWAAERRAALAKLMAPAQRRLAEELARELREAIQQK